MEVGIRDCFFSFKSIFLSYLVSRGYLPRSILIPLMSDDQSDIAPPTPIRHDIPDYDHPRHIANNQLEVCLINSSQHLTQENERIYVNQLECQSSLSEPHPYACIDLDNESNNQEEV
jgi:hypothetical protein